MDDLSRIDSKLAESESALLPGDLSQLKEWLPLARRLRGLANQQLGPAVLRLTLVIDETGHPRVYTVKASRIEPKAKIEEILDWLAPGSS